MALEIHLVEGCSANRLKQFFAVRAHGIDGARRAFRFRHFRAAAARIEEEPIDRAHAAARKRLYLSNGLICGEAHGPFIRSRSSSRLTSRLCNSSSITSTSPVRRHERIK
jgi:hypothetical protein